MSRAFDLLQSLAVLRNHFGSIKTFCNADYGPRCTFDERFPVPWLREESVRLQDDPVVIRRLRVADATGKELLNHEFLSMDASKLCTVKRRAGDEFHRSLTLHLQEMSNAVRPQA